MPYLSLGHHYWALVPLFLEEVTQFTILSYLIPILNLSKSWKLLQITAPENSLLVFLKIYLVVKSY